MYAAMPKKKAPEDKKQKKVLFFPNHTLSPHLFFCIINMMEKIKRNKENF